MKQNHLKLSQGTYLHMVHGRINGKRILIFSEAIADDINRDFQKMAGLFYTGYELYAAARGKPKVKVLH